MTVMEAVCSTGERLQSVRRAVACIGIAAVISLLLTAPAHAAHQRFNHIHWAPGVNPNEINFVVQSAWSATCCFFCVNVDPVTGAVSTGQSLCGGANQVSIGDIVRIQPGPTLNFGDGSTFAHSGSLLYLVTSVNPSDGWFFGTAIDHTKLPAIVPFISKTYAAPGNYTAFIQACCRTAQVNNSGNYRIQTTVNVGTGNRSPLSLVPPVVLCPIGGVCNFPVAASDPDGDTLRFRFSTPQEATGTTSFIQPGPPHAPNPASIDPVTGMYTWDTTGATIGTTGLYSTHVTIEDLDGGGNVKSAVAVDFFIKLVTATGNPPAFDVGPCGQILSVAVGTPLMFTVEASDTDLGDIVTLNVVGLPVGAIMAPPLPAQGNPVTSDFAWMPGPGDIGTHIMIFSAQDQFGQAAPLCTVTVEVSAAPVGPDCVYSQGFWKNHFEEWPVSTLTLGGVSYTDVDLLAILNQPVRGNGLVLLSRQVITALLNQANGASADPTVQQAIDDAHALIGNLVVPPIGTGSLRPNQASGLSDFLDSYNNGNLGTPHCDH